MTQVFKEIIDKDINEIDKELQNGNKNTHYELYKILILFNSVNHSTRYS